MMLKNLKIFFLATTALLITGIAILAIRPVAYGNHLTLAALKDITRAAPVPSFSKPAILKSFLQVDLAERIKGRHNVKSCLVGEHTFMVPDAFTAKTLLIDIFIRQDYYFPYQATTPLIIDCGANIGFSAAYFKMHFPQSKIIAFEPEPKNFSFLEKNVATTNYKNIVLHKKAVAEKAGKVFFAGTGVCAGIIEENSSAEGFYVEAIQLSDFITEKVDILKMDIEGAEAGVLRELAANNKLHLIQNIIMEYHYTPDNPNALPESLTLLSKNNFNYIIKTVSGMHAPFEAGKSNYKMLSCLMIYAYQKA